MLGPLYPLFPIASFLGFFLVLLPLPWHLEAWNSGTCYYMMWTALACLNRFINSIMWANDAINRAPIFCDICASAPSRSRFVRLKNLRSHQDNTCRINRYPRSINVHCAQIVQHFPDSSRRHHARGGRHFDTLSLPALTRQTETPSHFDRFFDLRAIPHSLPATGCVLSLPIS